MDDTILSARRQEVERLIADHLQQVTQLKAELGELEIAQKVYKRLSGASGTEAGAAGEQPQEEASGGKPEGLTMPQMIGGVLILKANAGQFGLTPKEITAAIAEEWWPQVRGDQVNSIVWRMLKRGELVKAPNEPRYYLPQHVSASGEFARTKPPEAGNV